MKKLSVEKLADTVTNNRKFKKYTQRNLSDLTGINRTMISRIESCDYVPSIDQLQALAEVLDFEIVDLFEEEGKNNFMKKFDKNIEVKFNSNYYNPIKTSNI